MKNFLFALACLAAVTCQAQLPTSGPLVGEYLGIALPSTKCGTERLFVIIHVNADYTMTGTILNWDNYPLFDFAAAWPYFDRRKFSSSVVPYLENSVKASISPTSGSMSGVVDFRPGGGCRYTFKAYRRFKNN